MTPSAVIQVKRGIGDVVWHLPFVRAIAAAAPGGQVTFLAPPSSHAQELLAAEPSVAETIQFEHHGSELQRGINLLRLAALLRRRRFRTVWILDRTLRPALAATLAGIPERIGLGFGAQRLFITNQPLPASHFHDHPIDCLRALMAAMKVGFSSTEPALPLPDPVLAAIGKKFAACARPWSVIGLGAFHAERDWSDEYWLQFLDALRRQTSGTIFLIGGCASAARADRLIARSSGPAINACTLPLIEAAALLKQADLFVGPDSGPMNLAAAVGTETFGLFGVNPVLSYSKYIHALTPDGGPAPGGMQRILPATVLERIAPYLAAPARQN